MRILRNQLRHIAEEGFDPEFGVRPLHRAIQRWVDNDLYRLVLGGSLESRDKVLVGTEEGEFTFEVVEGAATVGATREEAGE